MPATKLMSILSHPIALDAFNSLSKGSDPKGVLAGIASDIAAAHIRELLGAKESVRTPNGGVKNHPTQSGDDVVDAEFKVINVTPKKGSK